MFDLKITREEGVVMTATEDERQRLLDTIEGTWDKDSKLYGAIELAAACSDGQFRVTIPQEFHRDFAEAIEANWPDQANALADLRDQAKV